MVGEYGHYVHLDLRHLGEKIIDSRLPFVRELCAKYENIDPVTDLIPVRPVVHYMMGGISTDIDAATVLPGVYSAGEAACVSINGANRLGSNSLTEILVFGARAGKNAAAFALEQKEASSGLQAQVEDERNRLAKLMSGEGTESIAGLRKEMHDTMEEGAGIYRTGDSLAASGQKVRELQERVVNVKVSDASHTFNTDLTAAIELTYMLDGAEAIIASALLRDESRGSHQRSDFPERDDDKFLQHSLAYREPGGSPRIEYQPVSITRWPPAKREYGQQKG